jgi:adenylate cyclase
MSRLSRLGIVCVLTGVLGLGAGITPLGLYLEENAGLYLLFHLRGVRLPPPEVVVVAMDHEPADGMSLASAAEKLPRSVYAGLVDNLVKAGASTIAFDILFDAPGYPEHDVMFAEAMGRARNVVLCESLKSLQVPMTDKSGAQWGSAVVERLVRPSAPFERSAIASSPFILPKVPVRVNQYWTFKAGAGDKPTLPVVAFQVFTLELLDDLFHLLQDTAPFRSGKPPPGVQWIAGGSGCVEPLMRSLRDTFNEDPLTGEKMLETLNRQDSPDRPPPCLTKDRLLGALIQMYRGPDVRYLNFYGPPGTITTVPCRLLLENDKIPEIDQNPVDLKGKAVFVGVAGHTGQDQRDGFYTVFSQPNGRDIGGVEIAATAFANILEDMHIKPLSALSQVSILLLWGLALGILCHFLPALIAAIALAALGAAYFYTALNAFNHSATWYPLVAPLFVQCPSAFLGAFAWKYYDANRERKNIRRAFGLYLPDRIVDQLAKDLANIRAHSRLLYGTCLCTDGEQYTSLSERMAPMQLSSCLNRYYEFLFEPVRRHGGMVSDIIGDAMMAVWAGDCPDATLRAQACLAALDVVEAVRCFNALPGPMRLPTRIGMHWGEISLGNIGGGDHYEYRPVGDTVNTASRIEGLNKILGTRILASDKVVHQLDGFLTRDVGEFILKGKSNPVVIHELLCRMEAASEQQKSVCEAFSEGLRAYRSQSWDQAIDSFKTSLSVCGEDGPARFYLALCEEYSRQPPCEEAWDGVIRLTSK